MRDAQMMMLFLSFIFKCKSIPLSHASLLFGINHLTPLFTTTVKAWILHRIRCRISFDKIWLGDPATTLYTTTPSDYECYLRQIFVRHFYSKTSFGGKFKILRSPIFAMQKWKNIIFGVITSIDDLRTKMKISKLI